VSHGHAEYVEIMHPPVFSDAGGLTDDNPECAGSRTFQELLQTPKKSWHKTVTENALNVKAIILERYF
jgi:hypothetical protein